MDEEIIVEALSALAHATRLRVYRILLAAGDEGLSAGRLAIEAGVAPTSLSGHLGILAKARIVASTRIGRTIVYAARPARVKSIVEALARPEPQRRTVGVVEPVEPAPSPGGRESRGPARPIHRTGDGGSGTAHRPARAAPMLRSSGARGMLFVERDVADEALAALRGLSFRLRAGEADTAAEGMRRTGFAVDAIGVEGGIFVARLSRRRSQGQQTMRLSETLAHVDGDLADMLPADWIDRWASILADAQEAEAVDAAGVVGARRRAVMTAVTSRHGADWRQAAGWPGCPGHPARVVVTMVGGEEVVHPAQSAETGAEALSPELSSLLTDPYACVTGYRTEGRTALAFGPAPRIVVDPPDGMEGLVAAGWSGNPRLTGG